MLEAAYEAGLWPRQLSFTTAMQTIAASWIPLAWAAERLLTRRIATQLASLAQQTVGNRPGRLEPRAVKRRPHPLALLTKPLTGSTGIALTLLMRPCHKKSPTQLIATSGFTSRGDEI